MSTLLPFLYAPEEIAKKIGENSKQLRLSKNLSRKTLSEKSGVPASTIKRFEQEGKVSLDALILLATVLGNLDQAAALFKQDNPKTIGELKNMNRQRGTR